MRAFHGKFGAYIGSKPGFPPADVAELRRDLIVEETEELFRAMERRDLAGVADALADLLYVVYGTAVSFGIDIRPVFAEVHRANMAKTGGGMRPDGKVLKPAGWQPPRIVEVLEQLSAAAEERD